MKLQQSPRRADLFAQATPHATHAPRLPVQLQRESVCLCGVPLHAHFDLQNRFLSCETLRRRRA